MLSRCRAVNPRDHATAFNNGAAAARFSAAAFPFLAAVWARSPRAHHVLLRVEGPADNHLQGQIAAKSLPNRRQIAAKSLPNDFRPATCICLCKTFSKGICSVFPFAKISQM